MASIPQAIDEEELVYNNQKLMQFSNVRRRYKNIQQVTDRVLSSIKIENYLSVVTVITQHIVRELMTPPEKRGQHQIDILVKASSNLPFFMEMVNSGRFNENRIHERICRKLVYVDAEAGSAIIRRGKRS